MSEEKQTSYKQVILVRTDIKMGKGKIGAQVAHASMAALLESAGYYPGKSNCCIDVGNSRVGNWLDGAFTKVCLKVDSEEALHSYQEAAKQRGLLTGLIRDNGTTVFHDVPTYTCLAIGPGTCEEIDEITGSLKLL